MAYDEGLAERVRELLPRLTEKKMFGGVCWMERGNMVVGVMGDDLLARVDVADVAALLKRPGVTHFTMGGKMPPSNKGWLNVAQEQLPEEEDLREWVERCRKHAKSLPAK
jgi:TfoX/Sxy family transcriptional regulator of competence genes